MFSSSRNRTLDFLRGLFVCIMTIDHLTFGRSPLDYLTGGGRLWFSAAEGFVLISGVVFGVVYPRYLRAHGWEQVISKAARRAGQLYALAAAWQAALAVLAYGLGWGIKVGASFWHALRLSVFQVGGVTNGVDLLPMYSLLLLWGLVVLYLLEKRRLPWVLALSFALWYARLLSPGAFSFFGQNFNPATWQTLFVAGLIAGYYRRMLRTWRDALPGPRWVWSAALLMLGAGLWGVSWLVVLRGYPLGGRWLQTGGPLFHKLLLKPGQIAVSLLVFAALYEAVHRFWKPLNRCFGWFLLPLGRHALTAYVIQGSLSYGRLFLPGYPFPEWSAAARSLLQMAGLAVTWLLTLAILAGKTALAACRQAASAPAAGRCSALVWKAFLGERENAGG